MKRSTEGVNPYGQLIACRISNDTLIRRIARLLCARLERYIQCVFFGLSVLIC